MPTLNQTFQDPRIASRRVRVHHAASITPASGQYRKLIALTGAAGAGTNYQVKVTVYAGIGADSAGVAYLNNHCFNFPNDIRFTDAGGAALSHWYETNVGSNTTYRVFWVKVAADLSAGTVNIYVVYGKPRQPSAANGNNTFQFFDDFDTLPNVTVYVGGDASKEDFCIGGIECPDSTLLAAWEHGLELANGSVIYLSKSTDGGATWGAPNTTFQADPSANGYRCTEPQFLRIGTTIWCFFTTVNENGGTRPTAIYYKTSTDSAATWSGTTSINTDANIVATIQNPIIKTRGTNIGRIILPLTCWNGTNWFASILYSDDNCTTWNRGGDMTTSAAGYTEPSIVELSNGDLFAMLRSTINGLLLYYSKSTDGGATWSAVVSTGIQNPNAQVALIETSIPGHYVMMWNDHSSAATLPYTRIPLVLSLSTDDCATWSRKTNLRGADSQAYSNGGLFKKANGDIVCVYDNEVAKPYTVFACVLRETDLDGKAVNDWVAVGTPVIAPDSNSIRTFGLAVNNNYQKSVAYTVNRAVAIRARARDYTATDYPGIFGFGVQSFPVASSAVLKTLYTNDQFCLLSQNGANREYIAGIADDDSYHLWDITWTSAKTKLYLDGSQQGTDLTNYQPNTALPVTMGWPSTQANVSHNELSVDWIAVRKYVDTEPSVGTPGIEEFSSVGFGDGN